MEKKDLFVIGIGASAGGLDAIIQFFKNCSPDLAEASFVVITHLHRNFKSQLSEIIQRNTFLTVKRMQDGELVKEGIVYILPENKIATIEAGRIIISPRPEKELENKAIDRFFISLATEMGDRSIGIILSGTGTDGLKGAKKIEEKKGLVIVQDPLSAQFTGMPLTTISLDSPDLILKPKDMPKKILEYLKNYDKKTYSSQKNIS